jgi:DNA-binding response OmpR family regulator
MNGIDLCQEIRKSNKKIPIIMLTAMGTTEDKLKGFDSGADDYLVKPFEFRELLARIRLLLKRISIVENEDNLLSILDLKVNLNTCEVFRDHKKINLTQKELHCWYICFKTRAVLYPGVTSLRMFGTSTSILGPILLMFM